VLNEKKRQAFEADLAVLVAQVVDPRTAHLSVEVQAKISALHAAELYLRDYTARGFPTGSGEGGRSTDVADPTFNAAVSLFHRYENDRDDLDHALKMTAFHAAKAAAIVGRMRPVGAVPDAPDSPCGVLECPNVCTGEGNDRVKKPKGSLISCCPRCAKHFQRHGRHWPKAADGRDVRLGLARPVPTP
jgi:hypothetical protein